MNDLITEARNATLEQMVEILKTQRSRRLDLVVPASQLRVRDANVQLSGLDRIEKFEDLGGGQEILLESYDPNGTYRPTRIFDEHVADRFDIPLRYVRRLRSQRPDLYDTNVNGLIQGRKPLVRRATDAEIEALATVENPAMHFNEDQHQWFTESRPGIPGDKRKFMLRLFRGEEGTEGVARALMSNRFAPFDNLDGLMALLSGLEQAGIDPTGVSFDRLDLTERGMYVRVAVPEIRALAPELCKGYQNPFTDGVERAPAAVRGHEIEEWRRIADQEGMGYSEEEGGEPVVFAGLGFGNSEVGGGAFSTWPEVVVQICKNGLQLPAFKVAKRHVGGALEEGVHWQADTHQANLDLVVKQTRDLVTEFLTPAFLQQRVDEIEEKAGARVKKPAETIKVIGKTVGFTDAQVEGVLDFFIRGGQATAGGLANAITAFSQTVLDPDEARQLDAKALDAMVLAAKG